MTPGAIDRGLLELTYREILSPLLLRMNLAKLDTHFRLSGLIFYCSAIASDVQITGLNARRKSFQTEISSSYLKLTGFPSISL